MKVEIFSAGCRLCDAMLQFIKSNFPKLEFTLHLASD